MYHDTTFPPPDGRLAQFARMIAAFERDDVETAVDMLIERLDERDGDPDVEANGDELDGTTAEDDFAPHSQPFEVIGCPIADPSGTDEDSMGDPAWVEWGARPGCKLDRYGAERLARDKVGNPMHEDQERDGETVRRPFRDMIRAKRCELVAPSLFRVGPGGYRFCPNGDGWL